jgi:DNA (cytosine-5)-methyltransferase 1
VRVLDLFSGIGGFSLGLERAGMETVAFCEYDKKCRQVLKKHWPDVPQYEDVRTLTKEQLDNDGITDIGLICGGYPCQPFSTAGKRQGEADDRALWKEYFRLVKEIRPTWVIAENVAGHISMGIDNVLADLEGEDYAVQTFVIPACAVGAYHRRDRVWIVANANELANGQQHFNEKKSHNFKRENYDVADSTIVQRNVGDFYGINDQQEKSRDKSRRGCGENGSSRRENVADAERKRQQGQRINARSVNSEAFKVRQTNWINDSSEGRSKPGNWLLEPAVGRVANGVSGRVDRLKQLGNAVVPQIPEMIGRAINDC